MASVARKKNVSRGPASASSLAPPTRTSSSASSKSAWFSIKIRSFSGSSSVWCGSRNCQTNLSGERGTSRVRRAHGKSHVQDRVCASKQSNSLHRNCCVVSNPPPPRRVGSSARWRHHPGRPNLARGAYDKRRVRDAPRDAQPPRHVLVVALDVELAIRAPPLHLVVHQLGGLDPHAHAGLGLRLEQERPMSAPTSTPRAVQVEPRLAPPQQRSRASASPRT